MLRKKITYIVSRIDKALEFEWVAEFLDKDKFDLSFIILGSIRNTQLKQRLNELTIPCEEIYLNSRTNYPSAVYQVYRLLNKLRPDIVHCHLIDATLIGLFAAKIAGIKTRIYTRHHSTFHHQYAPHAIKYDVWANRNATKIIAISPMVAKILLEVEHADALKVVTIPHGFPESTFQQPSSEKVEQLRLKYQLSDFNPIIGVVSRYDKWKGVDYVIQAFSTLLEQFPGAKLLLANASKGDDVAHIRERLRLLPKNSYTEIDFEPDNKSLFKLMDVFVHVPVDNHSEAFGQVYVEAMANLVPMVATQSGIGNEALIHLKTGYVVPYRNANAIVDGVSYVLNHKTQSSEIVQHAFQFASTNYTLRKKIELLEKLYLE